MKKRIAVLGATGSIGRNTLDVIRANPRDFEPVLLSAKARAGSLRKLGEEFPGAALCLAGDNPAALPEAIGKAGADITVNGISGAAGLESSMAVLEAGSDLALANKESIVMAGPLVLDLARKKGKRVVPVDSEHTAILQLIRAHNREKVAEILLTASGGPFRSYSREELEKVKAEDALSHPTWKMGPKITIDSASLANKGLEVIEAVRLFDMPPDKVSVVIHPQSVVHSMVRMGDGAVYAQLSRPDMRLAIQEALYWPESAPSPFGSLDFAGLTLEFEKPDGEKFPMLPLAYQAARQGGLYPCVYNGANEEAVAAFFSGEAGFLDIPLIVDYVLQKNWTGNLDMGAVLEADRLARERARLFIKTMRSKG
ncbi:MAG: 1-deoxy-D-xylulose-5-phosphate reductoisomerase [Treponema sp.]|jgi:1-deoxy-D-xylulose-5-phosphate reductoisomerase|nr:1-deoxy-D-xylulose-5-phosphate reductoisomerase [Treponema sp.]